jgi:hypothetical protein
MKTFKHITYTWLLAQVFHPFIFMITVSDFRGDFEALWLLLLFGFLFSVPGYVFCLLLFYVVIKIKTTIPIRFIIWILTAVLCVIAGVFFIVFVDSKSFFFEAFAIVIPGCIAAVLSILCRYGYFVKLCNSEKENEYENDDTLYQQ